MLSPPISLLKLNVDRAVDATLDLRLEPQTIDFDICKFTWHGRNSKARYLNDVLEVVPINQWSSFTIIDESPDIPLELRALVNVPFADANRLENVKVCSNFDGYPWPHVWEGVESMARIGMSASSIRRLEWQCQGAAPRLIKVGAFPRERLEKLMLRNQFTWRNNLSLIRDCTSLVFPNVGSESPLDAPDHDLDDFPVPVVHLPRLRSLHLGSKCTSEISAAMKMLRCPELKALYLSTRGPSLRDPDDAWKNLVSRIISLERPLKYLKFYGIGARPGRIEPILLSSPQLSLIPVVDIDMVNLMNDKWTPETKYRFESRVQASHPTRRVQSRVHRDPRGANAIHQCIRGGWFDRDVLNQLHEYFYRPDMAMDNSMSRWMVHQNVVCTRTSVEDVKTKFRRHA